LSFTIHGIGVSGGIAIGHAQLVSHAQLEVAHYDISKSRVAEEKARFDAAVVTARAELASLGEHIPAGTPAEFEAFLNVHLMILDDPTLSEMPKQLIETLQCNAEWALKLQMDALIDQFESIEDGYLRDRKTDVIQVVERILKVLMGRPGQVLARGRPRAVHRPAHPEFIHDIDPRQHPRLAGLGPHRPDRVQRPRVQVAPGELGHGWRQRRDAHHLAGLQDHQPVQPRRLERIQVPLRIQDPIDQRGRALTVPGQQKGQPPHAAFQGATAIVGHERLFPSRVSSANSPRRSG